MKMRSCGDGALQLFVLTSLLCAPLTETVVAGDGATGDLLRELVAAKWGQDRVVLSSPTALVQYEADLGERWIVDFESGDVVLECLWRAGTPLDDPDVRAVMVCAVSNLYVSRPLLPETMLEQQQGAGSIPGRMPYDDLVRHGNNSTYTVRPGDTLSGIAKEFRVSLSSIIKVNALQNPDRISVNHVLIIPEPPPHGHQPGEAHVRAAESILRYQIVDELTGERVTDKTVGSFGRAIVARNGVEAEDIQGADGRSRRVSRIRFKLVPNHLQVRAQRYYPMVLEHAERFGHDPAVVMAMVHTESAFNPMATSPASAYGLMQLVPSSGGREAYRWLHRKDINPSPSYLLRPRENVELGTAYLKILNERTFKGVKDPASRLYCAVAAYNGGGGNVGRAFTGRKSVRASVATINAASSEQVLQTLQTDAPHKETRDYVKRVFERTALYRAPAWPPSDVM